MLFYCLLFVVLFFDFYCLLFLFLTFPTVCNSVSWCLLLRLCSFVFSSFVFGSFVFLFCLSPSDVCIIALPTGAQKIFLCSIVFCFCPVFWSVLLWSCPFMQTAVRSPEQPGNRQAPDITPAMSKSSAQMVKSRESRGLGRFSTVPEDKDRKIPAGTKKRAAPLSALLSLLCTHLFPAGPVVLVLPFLPGSCDPSPHNPCSSAHRSHFRSI